MDAGGLKGRAKHEINVTPLIDIVLVLLIVFIVLIPGLTRILPVSPPKVVQSDSPKPDPANPPVVVTIQRSGSAGTYQYLLQDEPVPVEKLADRLAPVVMRQVPGLRKVFLKVDGEAPHGVAVGALDQIRRASDRAKRDTLARTGVDGGDVKVVISMRNA